VERFSAWLERHLAAAALAEEGLREEAVRLARAGRAPREEDALEALLSGRGVRMLCGALSPAALSPRR
jgi:hypothetical protein